MLRVNCVAQTAAAQGRRRVAGAALAPVHASGARLLTTSSALVTSGSLDPCNTLGSGATGTCALICAVRHGSSRLLPPPPPVPRPSASGVAGRGLPAAPLPPPPPLSSSRLSPANGGGTSPVSRVSMRSAQEIANLFVAYVPTYAVSLQCVASTLPEDVRAQFVGRGRLMSFMRRFPFIFDVTNPESGRVTVRLHPDLIHPQRGIADEKYMMSDVGAVTSYVAKPEFIVMADNIEASTAARVYITPPAPPPSMRVRLEERVPVVERLRGLVPADFIDVEVLEDKIPEDILFHPYFNCQGGFLSIASKLPDEFQVVGGRVRRRPPHLAPLALDEFTLDNSPMPEVAAQVRAVVCDSEIPHWVSITPMYEALSRAQKREIKQRFRSFAGFLRVHGRALAVSTDMLQVSMWICVAPPKPVVETVAGAEPARADGGTATAAVQLPGASAAPVVYTREQVVNALYDRLPANQTLNLRDALQLLPVEMRSSGLPTKVAPWLATHPNYFTVDFADADDAAKVLVRRASDLQPLDLAAALYAAMPDGAVSYQTAAVLAKLDPAVRAVMEGIGLSRLATLLPEWIEVQEARGGPAGEAPAHATGAVLVRRLRDAAALEAEVHFRKRRVARAAKAAANAATDSPRAR